MVFRKDAVDVKLFTFGLTKPIGILVRNSLDDRIGLCHSDKEYLGTKNSMVWF